MELSPWTGIDKIPSAERNGFERDFACAKAVLEGCMKLPCSTLEQAARLGRQLAFVHYLVFPYYTAPPAMNVKTWEAARHVERLTAMRFSWRDPASQRELSAKEATRRPAEQVQMAAITLANADRALFRAMSADEFVVALVGLSCCQTLGHLVSTYNLAVALWCDPTIRERIRTELLPQLAARDVGKEWHMDATQWEAVWLRRVAPALLGVTGAGIPPTSSLVVQGRAMAQEAAQRLAELEPTRPLSQLPLAEVADSNQLPRLTYSAAMAALRLGQEHGNDIAVAVGGWLVASSALAGALAGAARAAFTMGELRRLAEQATAAQKRLKRWYMRCPLRDPHAYAYMLPVQAAAHREFIQGVLQNFKDLNDLQPVPPFSVNRYEGNPAEAAASEPVCDGCGKHVAAYKRCGQCRQRLYCGQACQAADWKAGHKLSCKEMAAAAAAEAAAGAAGSGSGS
ncbi:hypothetical protein HYH03_013629 [Edaphochlamys debaryana]|uniref:MYND-type domain-containing protein n=1 Tax=Edaphochlamys debaryana TaxID=47281 RepID=A0A835XQI6_9CHLO|nr:hypothetical protein HYH03_013629 [Edaphochlamys debaryana]|eukprot:KAG2487785.1 hypothetical protein HYH03_013629 [Edaphochlamys debaryana]